MCGIGGVVGPIGAEDLGRRLEAVVTSMRHRGPDDNGIVVRATPNGSTGLCATRLAIQDCSPRGHQPMVSERTGAVIAFNGELYNVVALREQLARLGYAFRGSSDTEVVLAAFDEWGAGALSRLRGMFGLAVWSERDGRMLIARDRLGIKPLYYHHGRHFAFASELRALLSTDLVPRAISRAGVASFLWGAAVQEPRTMYEQVSMLPAGHYAVLEAGRVRVMSYWSLTDTFAADRRLDVGRAEAAHRLRDLLEDTVRGHLVSDVPLGVFLSGGIDSSALVGLVASVADKPKTVSVVFPQEQELSERPYMHMVAERFGTEHTEIEIDGQRFLDSLPETLAAMDQPTADGVNTYIVSQGAREAGLTVVLSGLGGDELFAGYDTFRFVPQLDALRRRVPRALGPALARAAAAYYRGNDRGMKLSRWLRGAEPATDAYSLRRELFAPHESSRLVGGTPVDAAGFRVADAPPETLNRVSVHELALYMRNVLLRDSDVMSMAHSIELRVPFVDHEVVEFAASLAVEVKEPGGTPKGLLVDALSDLLPAELVHRPKMGFGLPFDSWMRGSLRSEVEQTLLDAERGADVAGIVDPGAVTEVWNRFLDGRAHWTRPWSLYVLKVWAEHQTERVAVAA